MFWSPALTTLSVVSAVAGIVSDNSDAASATARKLGLRIGMLLSDGVWRWGPPFCDRFRVPVRTTAVHWVRRRRAPRRLRRAAHRHPPILRRAWYGSGSGTRCPDRCAG